MQVKTKTVGKSVNHPAYSYNVFASLLLELVP